MGSYLDRRHTRRAALRALLDRRAFRLRSRNRPLDGARDTPSTIEQVVVARQPARLIPPRERCEGVNVVGDDAVRKAAIPCSLVARPIRRGRTAAESTNG